MTDDLNINIRINADGTPAVQGVNRVDQSFNRLERTGKQAARGIGDQFRGLATVASGFLTAFAGQQMIQAVAQMHALGEEARVTRARFEALADAGPLALGKLREATQGVVTDFELMKLAASAEMTGIVEDAEDAGRLISLGLALGGEEGVEKLFQALRNQSYLVLDTVGISAGDVRVLASQYRNAGMEATEAFNRATIEIGEQTKAGLGDAADAGITELKKLETEWENITNRFAENFATMIVSIIENTSKLNLEQLLTQIITGKPFEMDFGALYESGTAAIEAQADLDAYYQHWLYVRKLMAFDDGPAPNLRDFGAFTPGSDELLPLLDMMRELRAMQDMPLFGEAQFDAASERADELVAALEEAAKQDIISDSELEAAQGIADALDLAADAAGRVGASLGTLLGVQRGGGPIDELNQQVLDFLREGGMSEEELSGMARAFGLEAGTVSEFSVRMEDELVPMFGDIALQFGRDVAGEVQREFVAMLQAGVPFETARANIPFAYTGEGGPGQNVNVQPGWGWSNVARELGISDADMAAMFNVSSIYGGQMPDLHPGELALPGGGQLMPTTVGTANYTGAIPTGNFEMGWGNFTGAIPIDSIYGPITMGSPSGTLHFNGPITMGAGTGIGAPGTNWTPVGDYRPPGYMIGPAPPGTGIGAPPPGSNYGPIPGLYDLGSSALIGAPPPPTIGGLPQDMAAQAGRDAFSQMRNDSDKIRAYWTETSLEIEDAYGTVTQLEPALYDTSLNSDKIADGMEKTRTDVDMITAALKGIENVEVNLNMTGKPDRVPQWMLDLIDSRMAVVNTRNGGTSPGTDARAGRNTGSPLRT